MATIRRTRPFTDKSSDTALTLLYVSEKRAEIDAAIGRLIRKHPRLRNDLMNVHLAAKVLAGLVEYRLVTDEAVA